MSTKVRKQMYIEQHQARLLKLEAGARGISEAALVRQAIDNIVPELPRGGEDPTAYDSIIRYARRRLANSKRKGRAVAGARLCLKEATGRKGGAQTRRRPSEEKPGWTREDIYEERLSRYGKRSTR